MPALLRSADVVVACPGTSRSASPRWRRWPAAGRWSASAVGGLLDTVVDGVTGELVPPRDPACWHAALRRLLDRPEPRDARTAPPPRARRALRLEPRRARTERSTTCSTPPCAPWRRPCGLMTARLARRARRPRRSTRWSRRSAPAVDVADDGRGAGLADRLVGGGRLLAAGNGGSAAQAQHLTAELVGRYRDDRRRSRRSPCAPRPRASPRSSTTTARRGVRPPGRGARPPRRRPGPAVHQRPQPNVLRAAQAGRDAAA